MGYNHCYFHCISNNNLHVSDCKEIKDRIYKIFECLK